MRLSSPLIAAPAALLALSIGCGTPGDGYGDENLGSGSWAVHTVCATSPTTTPGIDVSSWQGEIDWAQVAQDGKVFAIIRVSHGTGTIDDYFEENWAGAKANGIIRGVYQYWEPSEDPIEQADVLIDKINAAGGLEPGDMPPVIDIESLDNATTAQLITNAGIWIDRVETALQRRVMIYTGSYFWDDHELGASFNDHPLWGPNYTSNPCPLISDAWEKWTIWQYSSTGSVSGIGGDVDLNHFDGTKEALQQFIEDSKLTPPIPDAGPQDDATVEPEASAPEASASEASAPDAGHDAANEAEEEADVVDAGAEEEAPGTTRAAWSAEEEPSGCACRIGRDRSASGAEVIAMLMVAGAFVARRKRPSGAVLPGSARNTNRASGAATAFTEY